MNTNISHSPEQSRAQAQIQVSEVRKEVLSSNCLLTYWIMANKGACNGAVNKRPLLKGVSYCF